jgi:nicotinate phosphoribosyltransferase
VGLAQSIGSGTVQKTNSFIGPLLTDLYQLTMAYGYWKAGRHEVPASFDLFFRKCPFQGEFAIFAGLSDVVHLLKNFHLRDERLDAVKEVMPYCESDFYDWLASVDASGVTLDAIPEGSVVFPRVPLITVTGPLAIGQLLESPLLNLVNFPTLVATNAARFRLAAGPHKQLVEFGLRRAQGPDGAMSATRYAYLGGFDGTSNVLASVVHGIPCKGTHAHAYVQSYTRLEDLSRGDIAKSDGTTDESFVHRVRRWRERLASDGVIPTRETNEGELAAFVSYAQAFPQGFLALVDTYNTLQSGVPNFLAVASALHEIDHKPVGVRLDSGDLAYLSKQTRTMFAAASDRYNVGFRDLVIVASNDINESVLHSLQVQGHEVDIFGIGTHLVTCQAQPALGAVYKLVEIGGKRRVKRSEDSGKITIPGRKRICRLFDASLTPLVDLMMLPDDPEPYWNRPVQCFHPFDSYKRTVVEPHAVETLQQRIWPQLDAGGELYSLKRSRERVKQQLGSMREDHLRPVNPTPYKVCVSPTLYEQLHTLLAEET